MGDVVYIPITAAGVLRSVTRQPAQYTLDKKESIKRAFGYDKVEVYEEEQALVKGRLGHPVFMPLLLEGVAWSVKNGDVFVTRIAEEMYLDVAMIECSRSKYMEETPMDGYDGVVIEVGGLGAWNITVRGLLLSDDNTYPLAAYKNLAEFESCPKAVRVVCDILNEIGVDNVVIRGISFPPMEGITNAQAFELTMVEDKELVLKLKNEL